VREDKKPRKEVEEEAKALAGDVWSRPVIRDRIKTQVDHHMNSMYIQMFGHRGKR
jgi:hypothetical protein